MSHPDPSADLERENVYKRLCQTAVSRESLVGNFAQAQHDIAEHPPWIPNTPTFVMGDAKDNGVFLMAQHFPTPTAALEGVYVNMLNLNVQVHLQELAKKGYYHILKSNELRVVFWFSRIYQRPGQNPHDENDNSNGWSNQMEGVNFDFHGWEWGRFPEAAWTFASRTPELPWDPSK